MKRKNTEQFIKDAKKVHGDKYDYSLTNYINNTIKIKIICTIHGEFEQNPNSHLQGVNCSFCGHHNSNITRTKSLKKFINDSKQIHGNKYDYSMVNYIKSGLNIKIICKEHGIFEQTPSTHLAGYGCAKCSNCYNYNTEEFIKKAKIVHGDKYDYSTTKYINKRTKLSIICPDHGEFKIYPGNFLYGKQTGCQKCTESKGEKEIRELLEKYKIKYTKQKRFNKCKNKNTLPFDFYLSDYNICIEFDGIHHFEPVKFWHGIEYFEKVQKNDNIKNEYCKNNNIRLIRIKYDENIFEKLKISIEVLN